MQLQLLLCKLTLSRKHRHQRNTDIKETQTSEQNGTPKRIIDVCIETRQQKLYEARRDQYEQENDSQEIGEPTVHYNRFT
ncbi:hypothetical protein VS_1731 [Vibrio atlanticus]|uniref:Uncharacterized protein n=1 Tax=Vibrio atlanticus (strain LGP32) TaxID=575788 RepID=B7VPG6_VIBA3|nr:hypothetical protein VS_1731 [Vibrio atlanticus]